MNRIRLVTFLIGLLFLAVGFGKIVLVVFKQADEIYSPIVLITIGLALILAVRKK